MVRVIRVHGGVIAGFPSALAVQSIGTLKCYRKLIAFFFVARRSKYLRSTYGIAKATPGYEP
jgi:hypothetical protein